MKIINTNKAPQAIGPYSQAVICNGFLFSSGQIAIDPSTQKLNDGDIITQTKQVLSNIKAILEAANITKKQIIKTTIFLKDINHFDLVNEIYQNFLEEHKPARSTIEVSRLPKDVLIEIEFIAKI